MRILVFSDSHGDNFDMLATVAKLHESINAVIHLGDCFTDADEISKRYPRLPVNVVAGNCDGYAFQGEDLEKTAVYDGIRIFMCHGHTCGVKDNLGIITAKAVKNDAEIAVFGHTHVAGVQRRNGVIVMNPGSISLPRGGKPPSYGIIEIEASKIVKCEPVFL